MHYSKEYYQQHKEKILEQHRKYRQSEKGKETARRAERRWRPRLKEWRRNYNREYKQGCRVRVLGMSLLVPNKRQNPTGNLCEMCSKVPSRLHYHHWDNLHPEWGVWVCGHCHKAAEAQEQGLINRYLKLKRIICEE